MNENNILLSILSLVIAYVLGSIPAAYIAGRLKKGIDIREVGSRNLGAMNSFYQLGFWTGMTVLTIDIGKGAIAVAVARWLSTDSIVVELMAGIIVILGHAFPVFLKFRGGKGGATTIGVLSFLMPWGMPFYLGVFLLGVKVLHFPTLSYSISFLCFPLVAWLLYHSTPLIIFSILILLIPAIRYIPRMKEMHRKGGGWKRVFARKNLKDRL